MSDLNQDRQAVLSTSSMTIGYPDKEIAKDINLSLYAGEMVCLLGQNGVGKSTLLKTLAHIQPSIQGVVQIGGKEADSLNRKDLARLIGIVTTEKVGIPGMTVRELVGTGRFPYSNWLGVLSNRDTEIVEEAISLCRINYLADQTLMTLSDGQRQKAMIARVLAQQTDIIILDEPTAHLDIVNRGEVMKLLSDIKKTKGKSILISTHELPLSLQFSDRLLLMNYNEPLVEGLPEDLAISGKLSEIFYNEEFSLDILSGKVLIHQDQNALKHEFSVLGEDIAVLWTIAALRRVGLQVNTHAENVINVSIEEDLLQWQLWPGEHQVTGSGMEKLLSELSRHFKTQA